MNHARSIFVVAVIGASAWGVDSPDGPTSIDGHWKVVSVELAGAAVPGLEGAELTLAAGKKTFKLPDGRVEQGTFRIDDAKRPKEIDSTTEGRTGVEK